MSEWVVKQGNTSVQDCPIKDKDGNLVTNLAQAEEIKFQVLNTAGEVKIEKTVGAGIEVNTPNEGYLRITLLPTDTANVEAGSYMMALQIKWDSSTIYEVNLKISGNRTEGFRVKQDLIA